MDEIIAAIVNDDLAQLTSLLAGDQQLAMRQADHDRLLDSRIYHWIYVGDTALHVAAAGYRVQLVQHLLAAGADAKAAANRRRSTPLHYASDGFVAGPHFDPQQQLATLGLLLNAGASINAQDRNGASALHRATRTRCADAVAYLLAAGADPLLRNESGSTPLHLAVQTTGRGGSGDEVAKTGQRRIIDTFLSHGVSVTLRDGKCHTVLDCARSPWVRELLGSA